MDCNTNTTIVNMQSPGIRLAPSHAFPDAPSRHIFPLPYVSMPGLSVVVDFDTREVVLNLNCQMPLEAIGSRGPVMATHPQFPMAFPAQPSASVKQEKRKGDPQPASAPAPHKVRPVVAAPAPDGLERHIIGSGLLPAVPRTHQIRHGPSPSFRGEVQTARRTGVPVARAAVDAPPTPASSVFKAEKIVKAEKFVKAEKSAVKSETAVKKAVKSEKVRAAAKLAHGPGKARMNPPKWRERSIRKTKHTTAWYASTYCDKLLAPPASAVPARNDVYVHYYGPADAQHMQIWLGTARDDDEHEHAGGNGAVYWRRVQPGIAHPDADTDAALAHHVLLVRGADAVAWVTADSARKHIRQMMREGLRPVCADSS